MEFLSVEGYLCYLRNRGGCVGFKKWVELKIFCCLDSFEKPNCLDRPSSSNLFRYKIEENGMNIYDNMGKNLSKIVIDRKTHGYLFLFTT